MKFSELHRSVAPDMVQRRARFARFILVALYTGTRHDAILRLQWMANTTGGWFDLDAGILFRRPQDLRTAAKPSVCARKAGGLG